MVQLGRMLHVAFHGLLRKRERSCKCLKTIRWLYRPISLEKETSIMGRRRYWSHALQRLSQITEWNSSLRTSWHVVLHCSDISQTKKPLLFHTNKNETYLVFDLFFPQSIIIRLQLFYDWKFKKHLARYRSSINGSRIIEKKEIACRFRCEPN